MTWIEINGDIFYTEEQQTIIGIIYASVNISFDITKYPSYVDIFFNWFEKFTKFDMIIIGTVFEARGVLIKSIDFDDKKMNISLRCDCIKPVDTSKRREDVIDKVLNNENK